MSELKQATQQRYARYYDKTVKVSWIDVIWVFFTSKEEAGKFLRLATKLSIITVPINIADDGLFALLATVFPPLVLLGALDDFAAACFIAYAILKIIGMKIAHNIPIWWHRRQETKRFRRAEKRQAREVKRLRARRT